MSPSTTTESNTIDPTPNLCLECKDPRNSLLIWWRIKEEVEVPPAEECSICFEIMEPSSSLKLDCNHTFHGECIYSIRHTKNSWNSCKCPLCRAPIGVLKKDYTAGFRLMKFGKLRRKESQPVTKARLSELILGIIEFQRYRCRIDPTRPNTLDEMEVSEVERKVMYHYVPEADILRRFGIEKSELKKQLDGESPFQGEIEEKIARQTTR